MYNSLALKLLDVYKYVNKSQLANNFISIKGDSMPVWFTACPCCMFNSFSKLPPPQILLKHKNKLDHIFTYTSKHTNL